MLAFLNLAKQDTGGKDMLSRGGQATTSYSPAPLLFQCYSHTHASSTPRSWRSRREPSQCKLARRVLVCLSQSSADGRSAVQMLMDLAMVGNMDGLLDLVPDSVVEKAVERKQQMR